MREILCIGKRVDNGEWVEGFYYKRTYFYGDLSVKHYIIVSKEDLEYDQALQYYEVIPETVGQYTGLTDKNGKKIFEGNIVDCWSEGKNARGTVQQRKDGLWIIYPSWQKNIMWGLCPDINGGTTVEVIGNIHDNPELLEAKNV